MRPAWLEREIAARPEREKQEISEAVAKLSSEVAALKASERELSRVPELLERIAIQRDVLLIKERSRYEAALAKAKNTFVTARRGPYGDSRFVYVRITDLASGDALVDPKVIQSRRALEAYRKAGDRWNTMRRLGSQRAENLESHSDLPAALLNLLAKRDLLSKSLGGISTSSIESNRKSTEATRIQKESQLRELREKQRLLAKKARQASNMPAATTVSATSAAVARNGVPPKRIVLQWADAELLACDFLRWLGYRGVQCTGTGADGGVDIASPKLVGQVKMHNRPTGRPDIQKLYGIAAAGGKEAHFFAMAFSRESVTWAKSTGVRLYQFQRDGTISAIC